MSQSSDPKIDGRALVESIKEKVSIVDIVSRYVTLSKGGKSYKGNCPFHGENTPSFYVHPVDGYWKCFGCGKGGDVITFVQEIEHISFKETLSYLAEIAGVELRLNKYKSDSDSKDVSLFALLHDSAQFYTSQLQKSPQVIEYLHSRGINDEMIAEFSIGYAPDEWQLCYNAVGSKYSSHIVIESGMGIQGNKGIYDRFRSRIMFPTTDVRGRVITFSGRIWPPSGDYKTERPDAGKYVNGPETEIYHKSKTLYGIYQARHSASQKKRLIITEGHLDCIMAHQIGYKETVAIGGTAFTPEHSVIVKRYCDHVILAFDGDAAGQKAILRSLPTLYEHGFLVTVAKLPAGKDPADCIQEAPEQFTKAIEKSTDYVTYRLQQLQNEGAKLEIIEQVLNDEIYPLLALFDNPLQLENAITTITRSTAYSSEAIREHIKRANLYKRTEPASSHQRKKEYIPPTIRELLVNVIIIWQEIENKVYHENKMLEYIRGSTGLEFDSIDLLAKHFDLDPKEFSMKFDWVYGSQKPIDILPMALKQFSEAYIRDTMQRQLTSLHQVVENEEQHNLIEQHIVKLSHYKRYIETHSYDNKKETNN